MKYPVGLPFSGGSRCKRKNGKPCEIRLSVLQRYKKVAERVGFEPTVGFPTAVFKTAALNRSAISPCKEAWA